MKTMVGAVAHDVTEGKVLVNGVAYSIKQGKTLVNGVAYDIGGEIEAPTQAELWADAVSLAANGINSKVTSYVYLKLNEDDEVSGSGEEVFIFAFLNGYMAVYCATRMLSATGGSALSGMELIYHVPGSTSPGATLDTEGKIWLTNGINTTNLTQVYGATLLAVEFPSYSKEQVAAAFANLNIDRVKVSTTSYAYSRAGRNVASPGSCYQYYSAFANCGVMFAAVLNHVKVYTAGLGNSYDTLTATFQTDSDVILGSVVASYGSAYNVVNGTKGSLYGASLIGLKEEA